MKRYNVFLILFAAAVGLVLLVNLANRGPDVPKETVAEVEKTASEQMNDLTAQYFDQKRKAQEQHTKEWAEVEAIAKTLNEKLDKLAELEEVSLEAGDKQSELQKYFQTTFEIPPSEVVAQVEENVDSKYDRATIREAVKTRFEGTLQTLYGKTNTVPGAPDKTEAADASFQ